MNRNKNLMKKRKMFEKQGKVGGREGGERDGESTIVQWREEAHPKKPFLKNECEPLLNPPGTGSVKTMEGKGLI